MKKIIIRIILPLIIFLIIIFGILLLYEYTIENDAKNRAECKAKGFECPSTLLAKQYEKCYFDCISLGKDYYKYDRSGFGSNECWCLENKTSVQIW